MPVNSELADEMKGINSPVTFTGTNQARVQQVIDLMSLEATQPTEHRLFLDKMSPEARTSMVVILTALKAAITNV